MATEANKEVAQASGGCPFHSDTLKTRPTRKTARAPAGNLSEKVTPLKKDANGTWQVRGYHEAKTLLRADGTRQAGFMAEQVSLLPDTMRPPVLFQEGETHHDQRTKTAKFFTPITTDKNYRGFMTAYADELINDLKTKGHADLSELSMQLAVQVAAQVVGLTDSHTRGMARRIEAFFRPYKARSAVGRLLGDLRNQLRVARFFFLDVQPAVRARRREGREDLITHLLEEGYSPTEILTECITFAAAGMVTTREFISVSAWHLLEHPDLKSRYLKADEKERHHILHELLRLEPVVGNLLRRAEREIALESEGQTFTIAQGDLIDFDIYRINADESAVGQEPLTFCPERERARGVQPYALSFGDGHHRCPGAFIAIQETDIFLTRLLALDDLRLEHPPELSYSEVVKGYEIRDVRLRLGGRRGNIG